AISLVFNVEELGRVEPRAPLVRLAVAEQGKSQRLGVQPTGIPELLHRGLTRRRVPELGTVAEGVYLRLAGLEKLIHQNTPVDVYTCIFEEFHSRFYAGGDAYKLAGQLLAVACPDGAYL